MRYGGGVHLWSGILKESPYACNMKFVLPFIILLPEAVTTYKLERWDWLGLARLF